MKLEIDIPFLNRVVDELLQWLKRDKRKVLPCKDILIRTYADDQLAVDVSARIVLEERARPSVEEFLHRITFGRPFCAICRTPLQDEYSDWYEGPDQIGYSCQTCRTNISRTEARLHDDIRGAIRREYDTWYRSYISKICEITRGKNRKYRLGGT